MLRLLPVTDAPASVELPEETTVNGPEDRKRMIRECREKLTEKLTNIRDSERGVGGAPSSKQSHAAGGNVSGLVEILMASSKKAAQDQI